jgi:tetratricopeptide (TPR) repeat protein
VEFSFSITDLKKSVPGAAALSALEGDALLAKLKEVLGRAAQDADVIVNGDMVTVRPQPVPTSGAEEAERLARKAAARAQSGEYEKAANIYRRVLELDPHRQESRRDLAMVLVEMGRAADAVDTLLDVLKVNPRDHHALIILGNHYARVERDLPAAMRFLERAAEIAPDDPTVHNSLGGICFEQKQPAPALQHFDRALALNPRFGNALYGKSMVLMHEGRFAEALDCLRTLFKEGDTADARVQPMLRVARENHLKLCNIIANDRAPETFKVTENLKAQAVAESGFKIDVRPEKLRGSLCAVTQMAWKYRRDHHVITLQEQLPAEMLKHHILCHECWHILLESRARKERVNRWFVTEDARLEAVVDSMRQEIRRIARSVGHDESGIRKLAGDLLRDGLGFLYNAPLDMLIESRLAGVPELREAQFCSLYLQLHNAASFGLDRQSRSVVPGPLLKMNDALNGAMALFVDQLSGGATQFFPPYEATGQAKLAREIHALCSTAQHGPGSEYALVDSVAELLGVRSWFHWKDDPGEFEILEKLTDSDRGGVTNPALLKTKSPEAVPFLLAALRRFERMDDEAIKKLTLEVAMLGQEGIDYSDSRRRHRLKAAPGEEFSGLEILCLLYAGVKRIAPAGADPGVDLNDEFAMALELFNSEKQR